MRTRGVRTGCWQPEEVLSLVRCSWPGGSVGQSHKGCPYGWIVYEGRAHGGEGTHKGCPYGMLAASGGFVAGGCGWPGRSVGQSHLNSDAKIADEGRVYGGEGTHKGCPYGWVFWGRARQGGEGAHKGCPYGWIFRGARTKGGGHPQGVPLRDAGSLRRFCP